MDRLLASGVGPTLGTRVRAALVCCGRCRLRPLLQDSPHLPASPSDFIGRLRHIVSRDLHLA